MKRLAKSIQEFVWASVQAVWSVILGNLFHRGVRVLVVVPDFVMKKYAPELASTVIRARISVRGNHNNFDCVYAYRMVDGDRAVEVVRFADLGVTWCYGWREEDKKVLQALAALDECVDA